MEEGATYPNALVRYARKVVPDKTTGSFFGASLTTMISHLGSVTYVSDNSSTRQEKQIEVKV